MCLHLSIVWCSASKIFKHLPIFVFPRKRNICLFVLGIPGLQPRLRIPPHPPACDYSPAYPQAKAWLACQKQVHQGFFLKLLSMQPSLIHFSACFTIYGMCKQARAVRGRHLSSKHCLGPRQNPAGKASGGSRKRDVLKSNCWPGSPLSSVINMSLWTSDCLVLWMHRLFSFIVIFPPCSKQMTAIYCSSTKSCLVSTRVSDYSFLSGFLLAQSRFLLAQSTLGKALRVGS